MAPEETIGNSNTAIAKFQASIADTREFIADLPGVILNASMTAIAHAPKEAMGGGQLIVAWVHHPETCLIANCLFHTCMVLDWFWVSDKIVILLKVFLSRHGLVHVPYCV